MSDTIQKGQTITVSFSGFRNHAKLDETRECVVLRAGNRYIEIEGFSGKIDRRTMTGRDNTNLKAKIVSAAA